MAIAVAVAGVGWSGLGVALAQVPSVEPDAPSSQGQVLSAVSSEAGRLGRPLLKLMVNGQGPFDFIVDTGANRTAVAPGLVTTLGLISGDIADLNGVTGVSRADIVRVSHIQMGDFSVTNIQAPVLDEFVLAGVDGILGVDALAGKRVTFDFENEEIQIESSRSRRRTAASLQWLDGAVVDNGLTVVQARIGGVITRVLIDTGAERTLGNAALRDAIARRRWNRWRRTRADVFGVTGHVSVGDLARVPTIRIGPMRMRNVDVLFGDFHVFGLWELDQQPTLLLGTDVLGGLKTLVIDYGTGDVFVRSGRTSTGLAVNNVRSASRVRRPR